LEFMRALLCTVLLSALAGAVADPVVPPGFEPVPGKKVARHAAGTMDSPKWMVTLNGDKIRVETRVAWVKRTSPATKAEFLESQEKGKRVEFSAARAYLVPGTGIPVEDGELFARDFGEFGGGIIFVPKDGGEPSFVSPLCTPVMVRTPQGVFAFQSLAHMGFQYADLVKVVKGAEGWETKPIASFKEDPSVIIAAGDRFLLAADGWVAELDMRGKRKTLFSTTWEMGAESLVKRRNGELWLGAGWGILRLSPKPNGSYSSQWFMASRPKKRAIVGKPGAK
jgi:hypothetical protein